MRLWVGRRGASLVAVGATLAVSTTGLAFASSPKHAGPDGQAAFAASARQVQAAEHFKAGNYIVVLKQAPAATYRGGVAGQRATAPGGSFAAGSPAVASYQGYLAGKQSSLAHQYGVTVHQRYTVALNGFSAHLSSTQARALATDSRVMGVAKDRLEHASRVPTVGPHATSEFLGLTHQPGVRGQEAPAQEEGQRQQPGPDLRRRLPQDRVPQGGRQDLPRQVRRRSALQGEHLQQQADLGAVLRHGVPAVPAAQHLVAARVRFRA